MAPIPSQWLFYGRAKWSPMLGEIKTSRTYRRRDGGRVFKAHRLVYHSTLGWRVIKKKGHHFAESVHFRIIRREADWSLQCHPLLFRTPAEREFVIDDLLVRIHFIIVMIRWTGLAPWEFDFPFPGSLTSTFLAPATSHGENRQASGVSNLITWCPSS